MHNTQEKDIPFMKSFAPVNNLNPKPDTLLHGETADCDGVWFGSWSAGFWLVWFVSALF